MNCGSQLVDKDFEDFDGICFDTLMKINKQKAAEAIRKAKRKEKKKKAK